MNWGLGLSEGEELAELPREDKCDPCWTCRRYREERWECRVVSAPLTAWEWVWGQIHEHRWCNTRLFDPWTGPKIKQVYLLYLKPPIWLTRFCFFGRTFKSLSSSPRLQFKLRYWEEAKMNHKLQASMTYCPIQEWKCGYWNVLLNNMINFKSLCLEQETKAKN